MDDKVKGLRGTSASMNLLAETQKLFRANKINTRLVQNSNEAYLVFENDTILGFVFAYEHSNQLLSSWESNAKSAISANQLALRRAGLKAWNTYVILLAEGSSTPEEQYRIGLIDEDLRATRKIARSGVSGIAALQASTLQLFQFKNAPTLEAVDMQNEIRMRTTTLPERLMTAFLSAADDNTVAQICEES